MISRNKKSKFKELAEKRVTRAIKDLRLVGNLANRANYDYDRPDAQKIISVLEKEMRALKSRFDGGESDSSAIFKL